ncbi:hypothetical protein CC1G_09682 [Coprinopsis cinerea okayama7|uniref:Uncharacterized protein n=1 Tax=Coprinopsis cinerea (strain Okayama-7 / 130 / ATCC MYA-4618 / FGSC 9003) TaxID=240176 RepID=A8P9I3_COPC7|nr:hypothetical protein CC1G_09682 [Coprinopsis cinerea okayama7\|eukprot:XP_001839779.2 hypothetical protein CC1G_09682 [Coprinopsis cinerea okayama7\
MIQGKFHTQEWDRFVGFMCMVFRKSELNANLARDSMHFVTRALPNENSSGTSKGGMFSNARSPSTKRVGSSKVVADNFALDTNNNVPIYDARNQQNFDLESDLSNLGAALPAWNQEVPRGSFVVVGYTAAVYLSNMGKWTLSLNIQWVIIIGCPDEGENSSEE